MEKQANNGSEVENFEQVLSVIITKFKPIAATLFGFMSLMKPRPQILVTGRTENQLVFSINNQLKLLVDPVGGGGGGEFQITFETFISQSFIFPSQCPQIIAALSQFVSPPIQYSSKTPVEKVEGSETVVIPVMRMDRVKELVNEAYDLGLRKGELYLCQNRLENLMYGHRYRGLSLRSGSFF